MGLLYGLIFFVWPFGSVFYSLIHHHKTWTKNIIMAFVVFYGYTFVLSDVTMDAARISEWFDVFFKYYFGNVGEVIAYYYLDKDGGLDFIQQVILYLTSLFTNDFQVLMGVLGLIFGFFYSRNICYLLKFSNGKPSFYWWLFLWGFACVVPFWNINGFRFWASSHMFFYAVIPYIYENKKKKLWLLLVIPFLHFSFIFAEFVVLIYAIFKDKVRFFYICFLLSFALSFIKATTIGDFLMYILPPSYTDKIISYSTREFSEMRDISSQLSTMFIFIINLLLIVLYLCRDKNNKELNRLFSFSLLFMAASNVMANIPSGGRFVYVTALFVLCCTSFYIQKNKINDYGRLFKPLSIILLMGSFGFVAVGFKTINVVAIVGNPLIQYFWGSERYVREFIPFL